MTAGRGPARSFAAPGPFLVVKFGGTSLQDAERIRRAARRVAWHVAVGRRVVVVVSALGRTTDHLLSLVAGTRGETADRPVRARWPGRAGREADRALATGEELSAALLSAALDSLGVLARSLRGGEAGVAAAGEFGSGSIVKVRAAPLLALAREGVVPVVAGFQGARVDGETVTLGRGGSDTTAVAVAGALAEELGAPVPCDIVTDVDGVYDRDPNEEPDAVALAELTHDELLELARGGAKVVHPEAARLARERGVPLRVYHFDAPDDVGGAGTRVVSAGSPVRALPDEVVTAGAAP